MKNIKKALVSASVFAALMGLLGTSVYANGQVGVVTADLLNIRSGANTNSDVLAQLTRDAQVNVIESTDGWYKVSTGNLSGWVSGQYLSVSSGTIKGTVTGNNVNVRTGPGKGYDVLVSVNTEGVEVLDTSGDWYKVRFSSGAEGWVYGDYVSTGGSVVSRGESLGNKMIDYAQKFLGVRYVWGGSSSSGFDCSGFVKAVYNNFGIDINRVAADQATQGTYVSTSNLRVGDLLFFDTDGGKNYINHVGIYMGNGRFIHASSGAGKVVTDSLWGGFYEKSYMTARTFTR